MEKTPILPTEGVSIGERVSPPDLDKYDPSTGQCISVIKTGISDTDDVIKYQTKKLFGVIAPPTLASPASKE